MGSSINMRNECQLRQHEQLEVRNFYALTRVLLYS